MIAFDYWTSPRAALLRVASWHLPARLRLAVTALCFSCGVVGAAWSLEAARLRAAVALENQSAQLRDAQATRLGAAQQYVLHVKRTMALDGEVRSIVSSGVLMARRLVALANDLPQNVWLSELTPQPDGMQLTGRSSGLPDIAKALSALARDRTAGEPIFGNAEVIANSGRLPRVKFSLKLRY